MICITAHLTQFLNTVGLPFMLKQTHFTLQFAYFCYGTFKSSTYRVKYTINKKLIMMYAFEVAERPKKTYIFTKG